MGRDDPPIPIGRRLLAIDERELPNQHGNRNRETDGSIDGEEVGLHDSLLEAECVISLEHSLTPADRRARSSVAHPPASSTLGIQMKRFPGLLGPFVLPSGRINEVLRDPLVMGQTVTFEFVPPGHVPIERFDEFVIREDAP